MKIHYPKVLLGLTLVAFFVFADTTRASDEWKDLRKELEELKQSQKAVQKDLQEIKNRLQSIGILPEEPKNLFLNIAGKPFTGNRNAKLTLVEFSEYQ
jgi:hypothetical protein